jgi:hypothetical protein
MSNLFKVFTISLSLMLFISCSSEKSKFPIEKRFWDVNDYKNAIWEIKYNSNEGDKYPSFNDSENSVVIQKITDHENFKVVLDDSKLGLKYRNEIAQEFFNICRDLINTYEVRDLTDHYVYEREFIEILHFGLDLQLKYFKLGNDELTENTDDPNSQELKNGINRNVDTLIHNFLLYLDDVNNEEVLSEEGKKLYAKGFDLYFADMVNLFPDANFSPLENKIDLMLNKSKSDAIKNSLTKLKELINSKKVVTNNVTENIDF